MHSWNEVRARQERHEDALRLAARDGLAVHELALREKRGKGERFHRRVMTWLGRGLVSWGWRLQEHSGASARAGATK